MIICTDPGHGGSDPGASGYGLRECDIALIISSKVKSIMESVGYEVVMTRESDIDVFGPYASATEELQARCDISDNVGADLLISIHCNAFNGEAKGAETFHYAGSLEGYKLANCVQSQIIGLGDLVNRGVKDSPLYITRHPNAIAILIELAFIDQVDDSTKLGDPEWQDKFAAAITRGITDYASSI